MTTRDLATADRTCSRVALLNRTVVAEGGPGLLADPEPVSAQELHTQPDSCRQAPTRRPSRFA